MRAPNGEAEAGTAGYVAFMRFADRPETSQELRIEAPPERVWTLCTDLPRMGEWSPENEGGQWIDGSDGTAVGARLRARNRHAAIGEWETTSVVVAYDRPRRFAWSVGEPDSAGATWSFELEADGTGTVLRQRATMGPGPSGTTAAIERMPDKEERIIARRLQEWEAGMQAVLNGIKAEAEARGRGRAG
jgi:uncharacterized protein YndB with AHSA1/START domain